ncbi:unnamed protein product, partial [marine sediment metagenome]
KRIGITLGDIYNGLDMVEKEKFYRYDTATPDKCSNCSSALCGICSTSEVITTVAVARLNLRLVATKLCEPAGKCIL